MRLPVLVPAVCAAMLAAGAGRAEAVCPWMSAATASSFLGVHAELKSAAGSAEGDSSCEFAGHRGAAESSLSIEVIGLKAPADFARYAARCGSKSSALRAIGNEAVACSTGRPGDRSSLVIGRVRDRAFTVRLHTSDASAAPAALDDAARRAAEQVAGALF